MESSLKRLWARQRSKSRSIASARTGLEFQATPTYEVHVSGPPPQLGKLPFKPSKSKNSSVPRKQVKAQSNGYETLQRDVEEKHRGLPMEHGGIKPILLGISRPSTGGSLAQAVNHAADAVSDNRALPSHHKSELSQTITIPRSEKSGKARYVDIFQVTARSGISEDNYNEDVARRNLDLQALAHDGPVDGYTSSSRYGEDVAVRNASIELLRDSIERSRDITYGSFVQPEILQRTDKQLRKTPLKPQSATVNGIVSENTRKVRGQGLVDHLPSSDSMNESNDAQGTTNMLPKPEENVQVTKPTQIASQPNDAISPALTSDEELKSSALAPPTTIAQRQVPRTAAKNVPQDAPAKPGNRANVSRPLLNSGVRGISTASTATRNSLSSIPGYRITATEGAWNDYHANQGRSRHANGRTSAMSSHNRDSQDAASISSGVSKSSSLRKTVNLSNRRIMDLTGDDSEVFTDTDAGSSYVESPEVHEAQFSPLYSGHPALITPVEEEPQLIQAANSNEARGGHEASFIDLGKIEAPLRAKIVADAIRAQNEANAASDDGQNTPRAAEPQIGFSKINTLASFSPRSSVTGQAASDKGPNDVPIRTPHEGSSAYNSKLQRTKSTKTEVPVIPLSISVIPPDDDASREVVDSPTIPMHPAPRNKPLPSKFPRNGKLARVVEDAPQRSLPSQSALGTTTQVQGQALYTSPESLKSADFVHPNRAFGVVTRDFAEVPNSDPSDESSAELSSQTSGQVSRGAIKNAFGDGDDDSEPYSPPRHMERTPNRSRDSGFDEVEFMKKQSQAKAAWERLQRSLTEGVDDWPVTNGHAASKSPTLLTQAPRSKFTRSEPPPAVRMPAPEETHPIAKQGPSFYSMVTSPSTTPVGSPKITRQINGDSHFKRDLIPIPEANLTPTRDDFGLDDHRPISPGEISLSSFPLPNPTPQHSRQTSLSRPNTARRNSLKSISSNTSAYSIPYHMVPGRSSSMRGHEDGFSLED